MKWSADQERALDAIGRWLARRDSPTFYLGGYAGTGKTTLARHVADSVRGRVQFGAFTGKAALVMAGKGCAGARTLHSLLYIPARDATGLGPAFELHPHSPIERAALLIVDEVSMVSRELAEDLLAFEVPVLVLGDPAQLPPVSGAGGYFTDRPPDAMLEHVHRQALDSPVLALATEIREGRTPRPGRYGKSVVCAWEDLSLEDGTEFEQVICGRNRSRFALNEQVRALLGRVGGPQRGDRLICLRNDARRGLLNGAQFECDAASELDDRWLRLRVTPLDEGLAAGELAAWRAPFESLQGEQGVQLLPWRERCGAAEFAFANAITCHKAQGSEWRSVLVLDESFAFGPDAQRWLYTAATRARERITIALRPDW